MPTCCTCAVVYARAGPRDRDDQKERAVIRGTLAELRSWAATGQYGVKWGVLIARVSDRLQLLLQKVRDWGSPAGLADALVLLHVDR
jgi:hypothetical protein